MKIIAIISILICSYYIGIGVSNMYKERVKFFSDLLNFLAYCKNEILFLNKNKIELIKDFNMFTSEKFKYILRHYNNCVINNNLDYISKINKLAELNAEQKNRLNVFLQNFGCSDKESEINNINKYIELFSNDYRVYEKENNTKSQVYKKLCSLFGILLCILFV